MDWFALPFMQRALGAGVIVASMASYLGVFVVQRKLSFLGSGLGHAAFGGVALGLLLHAEPLWVAVPFTAAVAMGITWIRDRTILSGDTAVGVLFAVSVALGIMFLSMRQEYSVDAFVYLFGSILAVTRTDLIASGVLLIATFSAAPLWGRWAYATFDAELARADGVPVRRDDYVLSVLLAIVVVVSVKVVGVLLVTAFLVLPAAAARLVTSTFRTTTLLSVACGVLSSIVGLLASYALDVPSGATIILVQALLFLVALTGTRAATARS